MIEKAVLEKNLQVIEKNNNHIIMPFDPSVSKYKIFREKGQVVVTNLSEFVRYDNSKTGNQVSDMDFNRRGIYFITGLFDIGAIEQIYNQTSRDSIVFVVEPHPEIFFYMVSHYNLAELFERKNFFLLVADYESAQEYFTEFMLQKSFIVKASNIQFYTSMCLKTFENELVLTLQKRFIESVKKTLFMLGNSTQDTMIGLLQNLLNLKKFCASLSVRELKNAYSKKTAVIVSAGPSLQKNIDYLKQIPRQNILILAVDTVLKKLLNMDFIPDAVFTIERPKKVFEYFYESQQIPEETVFVGPPVVYPGILNKFPVNRIIFTLKHNEQINEWLNSLISNKSDLIPNGYSVAHLAFSFARYLDCNPIIFIGQDLAYGEDGSTHSKGTIYENNHEQRKEEELWVEGYFNKKVKTNRTWRNFQLWFEEEFFKTKQLIINATEGGVKINHAINMPLAEALDKYATKKVTPLHKLINQKYKPMFNNYDVINERIKREIKALNKLSLKMNSSLEKLDRLEKKLKTMYNTQKDDIIAEITNLSKHYKIDVKKLGFFTIFIQTHITIASFELNSLEKHYDIEKLYKIISTQKKLFAVSNELSKLVGSELQKYLNTSFITNS